MTYDSYLTTKRFKVAIAMGFHLFPYRTEKLSPLAPMVLHTTRESRSLPVFNPDLSKEDRDFFIRRRFYMKCEDEK
jgi:hypothetical protein